MHTLLVLVQTKATTAPSGNTTLVQIVTQDVKFNIDDRVDLYCKVAASVSFKATFVTAKWIRNKTQEVLQKENFTVKVNPEKPFWPFHYIIDKVSLADKGLYDCKAFFWNTSSFFRSEVATYHLNVRGN